MKYTAEEVRNAARLLDGLSRRMLTDYAERIEASEGAVPIYQRKQDGNWQDLSEDQYNRVCNCALTITRILYTHPPAQAAQVEESPMFAISRSMHSYYTRDPEEARQAAFDGAQVREIITGAPTAPSSGESA